MTTALRFQTEKPFGLTRQRTAAAFAILAYFVGLCAVALTLSGVYTAWDRGRLLSSPTVDAIVRRCALHRDFPFQKDGGGVSFSVACDVTYGAADEHRSARVTSQWRHAGSSGTNYRIGFGGLTVEHPERILRTWIHQHPPGTVLPLHQRPGADSFTFVGVDPLIDVDPVPGYRVGFVVFTAIAIGLAFSSRLLRQPPAVRGS